MNITILLIGLLLVIVSATTILLNVKSNISEHNSTYDDARINSFYVKKGNEFEKILDNVNTYDNNKDDIFNDEKKLSDSLNVIFNNIDLSHKDNNIIDYKEKIQDESQNKISKKIVELSKSGLRAEEIAKILGKGIREVEIILKFQNKKNN